MKISMIILKSYNDLWISMTFPSLENSTFEILWYFQAFQD